MKLSESHPGCTPTISLAPESRSGRILLQRPGLWLLISVFSWAMLFTVHCQEASIRTDCITGDCENGEGRMVWYTVQYTGEFREGVINGQGEMHWADGRRYKGEWADGVQQGQGVMVWPDGRRYEGDWRAGKPHGYGKLTYPDGIVVQGLFRDGYYEGLK
ncbi:MAG: hypothetical protein KDK34_06030 [Leptospiraceae bacterium]|nr:hypothetical protein [Leptospiraceae bacterium]